LNAVLPGKSWQFATCSGMERIISRSKTGSPVTEILKTFTVLLFTLQNFSLVSFLPVFSLQKSLNTIQLISAVDPEPNLDPNF
jgi:hypothetical protein